MFPTDDTHLHKSLSTTVFNGHSSREYVIITLFEDYCPNRQTDTAEDIHHISLQLIE